MKNNGFTLIELLAVIVILAVIALITVPVIMGVIEDTREKAFKESLRFVIDAASNYVATNPDSNIPIEGMAVMDERILMQNKKFVTGLIHYKNDEIELDFVSNGQYCGAGTKENMVVVKSDCNKLDKTSPVINSVNALVKSTAEIEVTVSATDPESGIAEYWYSPNNSEYIKVFSNKFSIKNLQANKEYKIKVKVINGNKMDSISSEVTVKTTELITSTFSVNKESWQTSREVTINYTLGDILKYSYSLDNGVTWIDVVGNTKIVLNNNGFLIAKVSDGTNHLTSTYHETEIDNIIPTITKIDGNTAAWSINKVLVVTATDDISGLHVSPYSFDGGTTWQVSNTYTATTNKPYIVKVRDKALHETSMSVVINKIGTYKDTILNGTDPVLDSGMIPVIISNDGSVEKADLYSEWYNYGSKTWANAVLVSTDYRETIKSAKAGTKLDNTKILSYFVWAPRYKYELFNAGTTTTTPTEIKITFENKTTTKSNGTTKGTYFTHPSFTFGNKELNGFWVGKFETTGTAAVPTVLPNVASLRYQNVNTQFNTAKKFTSTTYGLTSESKMMKNNEWGAVAYLSHSKYGTNKEIRINNNSNYITGCGASAENSAQTSTCEIVYGSSVASYPQSTTGNISGIFDMSGGAGEYVMGNYNNTIVRGGFTTMPGTKYYNNYTTADKNTACNSGICKGDALSETATWYGDYSFFISANYSWFIRGSNYRTTTRAGLFSFSNIDGSSDSNNSFRLSAVTN